MAESKTIKWADEYKEDNSSTAKSDSALTPEQPAANDADGWQQYRRWISKAPAPRGRRVGIDPSLFDELAANLRRVFSGIVSGNVHEDTLGQIEQLGPFRINGSGRIMTLLDKLLACFVEQRRMKLASADYVPCYRVENRD